MTRAPGSIDNKLHESEKNRESNNAVLHFPLVLSIVGYHTRTQKQKRENLTAMPFSQFSIVYFVTSLRGVPTLLFIGRWLDLVDNCCKGLCNNYQEGGGGAEKREGGGALPKIAAKIGGLKSKITHLTEGGGGGGGGGGGP